MNNPIEINPPLVGRPKAVLCFTCLKSRAKRLSGLGCWSRIKVFCSHHCASLLAVRLVVKSGQSWCLTHRKWTAEDGKCSVCEIEKAGLDDRIGLPGAAAILAGQEVNHV